MKKIKIDKRLLIGFVVFSCLQLFLVWSKKADSDPKHSRLEAVDSFVPLGFTLVPIQIENQAELGSLIGDFAIVDLHKKGIHKIIESGVRLLRSPRNPEVFAVLVQQDRARELISNYGALFTVSLKNPDSLPIQQIPKRSITRE